MEIATLISHSIRIRFFCRNENNFEYGICMCLFL